VLAVAAGKADPTGKHRRHAQDRGKALASSSTLNRLPLYSTCGGHVLCARGDMENRMPDREPQIGTREQ
jgi:hypothetical protein